MVVSEQNIPSARFRARFGYHDPVATFEQSGREVGRHIVEHGRPTQKSRGLHYAHLGIAIR